MCEMKETEQLLEKEGWTLECESPLEIRHATGEFVCGNAATLVIESLRKRDSRRLKEEAHGRTMEAEEAKALLADLLSSGFGIAGHRRDNGADYYQCTACHARKDTMGYAGSTGELDDVEHKPDCGLMRLAQWANNKIEVSK